MTATPHPCSVGNHGLTMNTDWTCPFCNRHATITEESRHSGATFLTIKNAEGMRGVVTSFVVCPNPKCKKFTLTVSLHEANDPPPVHNWKIVKHIRTWTLIPSSRAQPFPDYIPKAILDDYNEACLIRDLSPKASATLSRIRKSTLLTDANGLLIS